MASASPFSQTDRNPDVQPISGSWFLHKSSLVVAWHLSELEMSIKKIARINTVLNICPRNPNRKKMSVATLKSLEMKDHRKGGSNIISLISAKIMAELVAQIQDCARSPAITSPHGTWHAHAGDGGLYRTISSSRYS
jgi:hypothetical protein